jgi:hypothetical protein
MQQQYGNYGAPRQPAAYAAPPPPAQKGSNVVVWVLVAVVVLCVVGAAIYFSMKPATPPQTTAPSVADIVAQIQAASAASTPTPLPQTLAPLCPENVAPVIDADGKVYKNVCYAQSVNAKGPLVPSAVGQPFPGASSLVGIPRAVGTQTALGTSAPVVYQGKGGQSINGVVQGRPQAAAQQKTQAVNPVKYIRPQGVAVPLPTYAGAIG